MQYRHANLNSYLHGPTYALGNSYASTQVARHNSYGRVQTIQYAPTSARGLTSSEIENMDKMQNEYLEDVTKLIFKGQTTAYSVEEQFAMTDWGETGGQAFVLQRTV